MSGKSNSKVINDIMAFLDWIMEQDEATRQQVFGLLKHHFDSFKVDLSQLQAGENPLEDDAAGAASEAASVQPSGDEKEKKGSGKGRKRRKKGKGRQIKLTKENILEEMIFNELLESPLATRTDDDLF